MESKGQGDEGTLNCKGQLNLERDPKANINVQCGSSKDILIPENDTKTDIQKIRDTIQTSPIKRHFHREKHRFEINSEKLILDDNPNGTNHSDTLQDVIIAANDDCSRIDSDDSGWSDSEDMQEADWVVSSQSNTVTNNVSIGEYKEISCAETKIPDFSSNLDVYQSIEMLNLSLAKPFSSINERDNQSDQKKKESLENKSAIWRVPNTWDLSKISTERITSEGNGTKIDNCHPDNEFMEADISLDDKVNRPASKIYDSSLSDSEDIELKMPLNRINCSPEKTVINNFDVPINDIQILDIQQSIALLKQLLPQPGQPPDAWYQTSGRESDENFINESIMWKLKKIQDVSKLNSESETSEKCEVRTEKDLPDDEYMEAERYYGNKGKTPASKRYAYKKKSKSTGNQTMIDSKDSTDTRMECDIEIDNQTSCSNITSPSNATLPLENKITSCTISEKILSESHDKLNFISENIKEAATEWDFHDYAFKKRPKAKKLSDLRSDYSNYNNKLFRNENYFDSQYSEEDFNLQQGLLLSLQSIHTSKSDDDSDVDIVT